MNKFKTAVELAYAFQSKAGKDVEEKVSYYDAEAKTLTTKNPKTGCLTQQGVDVLIESGFYLNEQLKKVTTLIQQDTDIRSHKKGCRVGQTTVTLNKITECSDFNWEINPPEKTYKISAKRLVEVLELVLIYVDSSQEKSCVVFQDGYVFAHDTIQMVKTTLDVSDITETDTGLIQRLAGLSCVLSGNNPEILLNFCKAYSKCQEFVVRAGVVFSISCDDASLVVPCDRLSVENAPAYAKAFSALIDSWKIGETHTLDVPFSEFLNIVAKVIAFSSQSSPSVQYKKGVFKALDDSVEIETDVTHESEFCVPAKRLQKAIKSSKQARILTQKGNSGKIESLYLIDEEKGSISLVKAILI